MKYFVLTTLGAASYGVDAYGANAYNVSTTETTTPPSTPPSSGLLADTGYNVIIPAAFALAIILASIILLVKNLKRDRKVR